jgi:hypothetical protein
MTRRRYVSRAAALASGADPPVQVLDECLAEIDRRVAAIGVLTVIDAAAARATAEASAGPWRADTPLSAIDGMPVGCGMQRLGVAPATAGRLRGARCSVLSPSALERHARSQAMTQVQ